MKSALRLRAISIAFAALSLAAATTSAVQTAAAQQDAPVVAMLRIPAQDKLTQMRTLLIRPRGAGPFPLAIINHGSVESAELRGQFTQPLYDNATSFFLRKGYAVALPLRPGHGETGGRYFESAGPCESADFRKAGLATADSIIAAIGYLSAQPLIKRSGIIVVGFSAGGWGALALASRNLREVSAVIAFAPVRGGRVNGRANNNCSPERLVAAARAFGEHARTPVLSIVADNDTFVSAELSQKIAVAFRMGGGKIDQRIVPAFGRDGHALFEQGAEVWTPLVEQFLKSVK